MAKRKSTKKSTKSTKSRSSSKTSSKRKIPTGYTAASYSSKLAIDALIKRGYMDKMGNLSSMVAYQQKSKSAAVKELAEQYSLMYPQYFGSGSAHQALSEHYSKSKSSAGLTKVIDKLMEEGKLSQMEGQYKAQDNPLLRALQKARPQMIASQQQGMSNILMGPSYNNVMAQSDANFRKLVKPFLQTDEKTGQVIWTSVSELIKSLPELAGPSRLAATRLWQHIQGEVSGLRASINFMPATSALSTGMTNQLETLKSNIGALVSMMAGQDVTAVSTGQVTRQNLADGAFRQITGTISLDELATSSMSTAGEAKIFIEKCQVFTNGKSGFRKVFKDVKDKLAQQQSAYNRDLYNRVLQNQDIVPQETIFALLRGIATNIGEASATGNIDARDMAKYEKRFKELLRQTENIPTMAQLTQLIANTNNPSVMSTLANKKYAYDILTKKIQKFNTDLNGIEGLKKLIDDLKATGDTKKQFVEKLIVSLDVANNMAKLTKEQKDAILKSMSGALATKEQYQMAMKATQQLRVTLNRVRSARTEQQARTELAYFTLNKDATAGLVIALRLGNEAVKADYSTAVQSQDSAIGKASSAAHQGEQRLAMFLVDPTASMNKKPFSTIKNAAEKTSMQQTVSACQQVKSGLGNLVQGCMISTPSSKDPRDVLSSLPSGVRAMGAQQVRARALAGARMLASLNASYKFVVSLAKRQYSGGGMTQQSYQMLTDNIAELKKTLNVSYDKSLSVDGVPKTNGFHYCAMIDLEKQWDPNVMASKAILLPGDLVFFPVFRGNTLYSEQQKRAEKIKIGSQTFSRQQEGVLTRRFGVNNLGQNFQYSWNPVDSELLRSRYFVAMYPFALNDKRFNEFYREELARLKGTKISSSGTVDASALLSLLNIK